jgi:hypothetical protein
MTTTPNAKRLQAYKLKMKAAGFIRLSAYIHPHLISALKHERKSGECTGRTLERLILGAAQKRPKHWD